MPEMYVLDIRLTVLRVPSKLDADNKPTQEEQHVAQIPLKDRQTAHDMAVHLTQRISAAFHIGQQGVEDGNETNGQAAQTSGGDERREPADGGVDQPTTNPEAVSQQEPGSISDPAVGSDLPKGSTVKDKRSASGAKKSTPRLVIVSRRVSNEDS